MAAGAKLSVAIGIARTYLNDDSASIAPDPVIIPKIQEAHRELQEELWVVGSPTVRAQSNALVVPAGTTKLSFTGTNPLLPADLLAPFALFESANGVSYSPMTEAFFIPPGYAQQATLSFWTWRGEDLVFGGATQQVSVVIQYRKAIPIPAAANDDIGILFAETYLGSRAAALVAGSLGNADVFAALTGIAKETLGRVVSGNRGQQKPTLRP